MRLVLLGPVCSKRGMFDRVVVDQLRYGAKCLTSRCKEQVTQMFVGVPELFARNSNIMYREGKQKLVYTAELRFEIHPVLSHEISVTSSANCAQP